MDIDTEDMGMSFPLRVVLTVVFGCNLARKIEDGYQLVTFLTGLTCTAENFEMLRRTVCKHHILTLYPSLDNPDIHQAYKKLVLKLAVEGGENSDLTIITWLSELLLNNKAICGEYRFPSQYI
ncbi:TPA: hypothetical protein DEP58_04880 [Patescibacteria group bacterium]|nr:MAG: hypothetical protein UU98_C0014G0005 [Parcubacteria group bacterium GW2011_GWD2_42_14]HCC05600.1 hypothetical protein [Patescibacteria group bacterium]